ncbi:Ldh family oxidoreductase [Asanoa sp. WMMD1127]|uniref:Ldh family oxidoreductase n=1 Tax=Asanoa sp. WMMD1127 TaxID=3016107 RepID=UPI0024172848|nr:Ldh family oxidoreductase [Asanoa sp. WMMD1127]MDG4822986.1 Ldh family oxidoreductase [Asanoa sp. WMMD1127]
MSDDGLKWSTAPQADPAGDTTHRVDAATLTRLATTILRRAGAADEIAATVACSLVDADLCGHDSHGVRRLVPYLAAVRQGALDPLARPVVYSHDGSTARVDGRRGFGQLAAHAAVDTALDLAARHGTAVVAVGNANHVGRLGEYVERIADADAIGIAVCNADSTVAPYGGRERLLGTNPLAWAAPRAAGRPAVVTDFATAATAEGKLALSAARGDRVPDGQLVGADGAPSTDPGDFYAGGALLPFGGHKGYALSVMIEIVGGLLSGAGVSSLPGYDATNGTVFVAVDIARFLPAHEFRESTERFCRRLAGTEPTGDRPVLVPGEKEAATRATRTRDGIPLAGATWRALADLPGGPDLDSEGSTP